MLNKTIKLPKNEVILQAKNISVDYNGFLALSKVGFSLKKGSICALVGLNGSGKSTLFKAIMGFLRPFSGEILINNLPVRQAQREKLISYVPQSEEVDWNFPVTVTDVVMMGRYAHMNVLRIPNKRDLQIVKDSLAKVEMQDFANRQIGELSGGQRKRAFLARSLAQGSQILLMDEPFAGVDAKTERTIIGLLKKLALDGITILVSTHDLGSIKTFCDHALLLNQTVLAFGLSEEVLTQENLARAFEQQKAVI